MTESLALVLCPSPTERATLLAVLASLGYETLTAETPEGAIALFERRHPDIRVDLQQLPWTAVHEKLLTAYAGNPVLQLLGVCMASTGAYTAMSVFWTTPDQALSLGARAIGIAVINATGNIGSALNPVVVGWLKDLTHSFATGLLYASVLLVAGAAIVLTLPIARGGKKPS